MLSGRPIYTSYHILCMVGHTSAVYFDLSIRTTETFVAISTLCITGWTLMYMVSVWTSELKRRLSLSTVKRNLRGALDAFLHILHSAAIYFIVSVVFTSKSSSLERLGRCLVVFIFQWTKVLRVFPGSTSVYIS